MRGFQSKTWNLSAKPGNNDPKRTKREHCVSHELSGLNGLRVRAGVDLRADEGSPSRETGVRPAPRTAERPGQKQAGQAPSGYQGAARQRVHPEVHREALQFFACQPRKLDEEARSQETESVKSYPIFRTFTLIWGNFADFRSVRP